MNINKTKSIQIHFSEALYLSENTSVSYCAECDYSSRLSGNLKKHIDSVHREIKLERFGTPVFCDQCLNPESGRNFRKHIIMVHGGKYQLKKKMKCDKCPYQAFPDKVKTHVLVVHLGQLLKCSECNNKFKSTRSLEEHKRKVHIGWQPKIKLCEKCSFKTYQSYLLREHDRVNHGGFLIKCSLCEDEYKTQTSLNRHMKTNHGGKFMLCEKCDFKTYAPRFLRDHENVTHRGLLFQCNLCENEYKSKSTLQKHLKTYHEGKKPQYKPCNICQNLVDERFMGQHLNTKHSGNFECEQCNSNKICSLHFKCNQCKFIALKQSGLRLHKNRMH